MPKTQSGAISFGLVHIPVSLYTATLDDDLHFNQLSKKNMSRIRYKKIGSDGREVSNDDIVKGYQYEKDKYVLVSDDELESIKTEKDRSIRILQFSGLGEIPVIYYDNPYYVLPEKGSEKAFGLLWNAMRQVNKVAIGRTVLGSKQTMLALLPQDGGLLMQTLFYQEEIRPFPKEVVYPEPEAAELDMALQLIKALDKPFDPARYHDEYQQRIRDLVENKIAGKEVVAPAENGDPEVANLMDALKASLAQAEKVDAG